MGSPLSPVVANLYMEAFEERALGQILAFCIPPPPTGSDRHSEMSQEQSLKYAPNRNDQTNFTTSRECLRRMVTQVGPIWRRQATHGEGKSGLVETGLTGPVATALE